MTAQVIKLRNRARMECSTCGASANASCDCEAPTYVPAGTRAAAAVAANPGKSDRAIAADAGTTHRTVAKARRELGTGTQLKRIGKDGKSYIATKRMRLTVTKSNKDGSPARAIRKIIDTPSDPIQEPCADCQTSEQEWQRSLSNFAGDAISMPAFWTRQFGKWEKFKVSSEMVTLAKQAASAWEKMSNQLNKRR